MPLLQGFVDTEGYSTIDSYAQQTKAALDAENYELATDLWGTTEMIILQVTGGIDFYNVLFPVRGNAKSQPEGKEKLIISATARFELWPSCYKGFLDLSYTGSKTP
jgi:hypothetical protein